MLPAMLPSLIPIFPLPNAVLFPSVFMPLHIFEDRYRRMVEDVLQGDRLIGMVLLRPGWRMEYEGRPAVYPVGCAGLMTHVEPLPDGRYNIVLQGLQKFRVVGEDDGRPYRLGRVEMIQESGPDDPALVRLARTRLETLLATDGHDGSEGRVPSAMPDEELVNALAQYMELEAIEKQALLECDGLLARCRALVELMEMKVLAARQTWSSGETH
jgi:Lon protease-like protein